MNAKHPSILAYAEKPRATFDRAKLARWAAGWLALFTVWAFLPFQLAVIFWLLEVMQ